MRDHDNEFDPARAQERLFTQDEVDKIVQKRLARLKKESGINQPEEPAEELEAEQVEPDPEATEEQDQQTGQLQQEIDELRKQNQELQNKNLALSAELEVKAELDRLIEFADGLINKGYNETLSVIPQEIYQPLIDYSSEETVVMSVNALYEFIVWAHNFDPFDEQKTKTEKERISDIFRNWK